MTDCLPCLVPFCRRTAARERFPHALEIICGKHYRLVDRSLRRRRTRLRRLLRRANDAAAERIYDLLDKTWERAKAQAIERAAGITA